jgi:hypothetical protein
MVVSGNCINDNSAQAIQAQGAMTATGNRWGASNGHSASGTGSGDSVNNKVNYSNYLTEQPDFCANEFR